LKAILEHLGIDRRRLALEWISAAEGIRFVEIITRFDQQVRELGPLGESEGLEREPLIRKLEASRMASESMRIRMAFAKQAKTIRQENAYGTLPDREKLFSAFADEMNLYEVLVCLREKERSVAELAELLGLSPEKVTAICEALKRKKLWEGELTRAS